MEALTKKKMIAISVTTILMIFLAITTPMIVDKIKIWRLNDAIEVKDRSEIEKWITRVSKDEIDAVKSNHPLNKASFYGDLETVVLLVKKDIDVNPPRDEMGNTPLLNALSSRNKNRCKIAKYLIDHGADVDTKNILGETALTSLIYQSQKTREASIDLFKELYEKSDTDSMFPNSYMKADSALEMVAAEDMPELVDWLIKEHGCSNSDLPCRNGSYIHYYYRKLDDEYLWGNPNMVEYIVTNNLEDANSQDKDGRTILSIAAEMGELEDCKRFLSLGVNPYIKDDAGKTAYDYAAEKNNTGIMELLAN